MSSDSIKRAPKWARLVDHIELVASRASAVALLCITFTVFLNASGRYLVGWSFLGGEELARLLTVWITFIGAFALVRHEKHVNIDLVLGALGPGLQRFVRGLIAVLGMLVSIYLIWNSYNLTAFSFSTGQMGTTLPVPRALFFLPVLVGSVLMLVAFTEILIRAMTNTLPPLAMMGAEPATDKETIS